MKALIALLMATTLFGCEQRESPKISSAPLQKSAVVVCAEATNSGDEKGVDKACDSLSEEDQRRAAKLASDKNGVIVFLPPYEAKKAMQEAVTQGAPEFPPTTYLEVKALAMKGNYQAQRNLAFGYTDFSYKGQDKNPILGCAWRIVILKSGSEKVNETDTGNKRVYCDKLDKESKMAAEAQAMALLKKILK